MPYLENTTLRHRKHLAVKAQLNDFGASVGELREPVTTVSMGSIYLTGERQD